MFFFVCLTYIFSGYRHMHSTAENSSSEESQECLHYTEHHQDEIKLQK